jgi:hypothetical protein
MGKIAEAVERERKRPRNQSESFRRQIEKNKEFKERMRAAGVEYGDKFTIPLMSRLGHVVKSK